MTALEVAVLDDYQRAAAAMADWSGWLPSARVTFFDRHIANDAELVAALEPFDVVVAMRERTPFPRPVLEKLPNLRLLVTTGMRNASIDLAAAADTGVTVCGTRAHPWSTAELTWALILELLREVAAGDQRMRAGGWQDAVGQDLDGRILGVLGLGRLGARVARIGAAFGMDVIAWSPHLTAERATEHGARLVGKAELFATAKVVTVHMVLSDLTRGLIGRPELSAMRRDAYLVNTSRFGLLDPDALRAALSAGPLAGAALDVYDTEPLPPDHWLLTAPRVLLSPHMGYVTDKNYRVFYGDAVEDIAAFLSGTPLRLL